jgi:hypothetical protein
MNDQTDKLLRDLATKLGTTADHLWAVLVHANRIEGYICAIFLCICVVIIVASIKSIRYFCAENKNTYPDPGWIIGGIIGLVVGFGAGCPLIYWAIMDTLLPEYGALQDILSHLGK